MKTIILGHTGFVGANLTDKLKDDELLLISKGVIDARNKEELKSAFHLFNPKVVYNLCSHGGSLHYVTEFAADVLRDNIEMSVSIYEAARSMKTPPLIVTPISNCSYPGGLDVQPEDKWLSGAVHDSVFSFANSKRMLYNLSVCYYEQYGVESCNLIFPNAFGINDSMDPNHTHALDGMIIRMIKAQRDGQEQFEIWGSGSPKREWIYVEDFCNLLIEGANRGIKIYPLNMAQGRGHSIRESAEIIKSKLQYEGELFFNTEYADGDPVKVLDDTEFRKEFPSYTFWDHDKAIEKTIRYYKEVL